MGGETEDTGEEERERRGEIERGNDDRDFMTILFYFFCVFI
jgi:hypothetical protein